MWLFEETRAYAADLDAHVSALAKPGVTLATYKEFLIRTLGLEAPLEAALACTPGVKLACELRQRSGLIVHDLLALGMTAQQIAHLPQCSVEPFANVGTALGWLYVVERSRLQHPLLCAAIAARLPEARRATDYFCRDEIKVAKRWDEVASALERFVDGQGSPESVRAGAYEAFQLAITWYRGERLRLAQ